MRGSIYFVNLTGLAQLDEGAWSRVYSLLKDHVFNLAMRRTGDRDLSLDVVQQVFMTAMATIDHFEGNGLQFAGWITGITRNVVYSALREVGMQTVEPVGAHPPLVDRAPLPDMNLMLIQDQEVFELALSALPRHWEEVLRWRYCEDLSLEEIGRRLELSPRSAESLVRRARNALQESIRGILDVSPSSVGPLKEVRVP